MADMTDLASDAVLSRSNRQLLQSGLADSNVLAAVNAALGYPSQLAAWVPNVDYCVNTVSRASCTNGRITSVSLASLSGTTGMPLPTMLSSLTLLTFLDLKSNDLTGTLPPQWSVLAALQTVRFASWWQQTHG
jgi:hypothetical protein